VNERRGRALLKPGTTIEISAGTLRTAGFEHTFGGRIVDVVELSDGAFAVSWESEEQFHDAPPWRFPVSGITVLDAAGTVRWTKTKGHSGTGLQPLDDPAIPDALIARGSSSGTVLHPWDGRSLVWWPER